MQFSSLNTSVLLQCDLVISHQEQVEQFLEHSFQAGSSELTNNPDLVYVNAADTAPQIAEVRNLIAQLDLRPYTADRTIFVVFQIDQASLPAQNALLKSLEEPPAHAQIILTASQLSKVLPTILSRCLVQKSAVLAASEAQAATHSLTSATIPAQLAQLLLLIEERNFSGLVLEAEKYKEKSDAQKLLRELMSWLHQQNQRQPSKKTLQQLQQLLVSLQSLEKNVNLRLAMEDCFFRLAQLT